MDQIKQKALKILNKVVEQRDSEIIDTWRYAQTPEDREVCAQDMRALGDLRTILEQLLEEIKE